MQEPPDHARFSIPDRAPPPDGSGNRPLTRPMVRTVRSGAGFNTLDVRLPAVCLEVEDHAFHHDSAVMMPVLLSDQGNMPPMENSGGTLLGHVAPHHPEWFEAFTQWFIGDELLERFRYHRRGMVLPAVCYLFMRENPQYRMLVAGHTDTSGRDAYNFELSDLRARNLDCLLRGDRNGWVAISCAKSTVADIQLICIFLHRVHGWPTNPGPIDDDWGPLTYNAVEGLQATYNESFRKSLAVDGCVGPKTWGAIFDLYLFDLAGLLDVDVDELTEYRSWLRYVSDDNRTIGCGERIPIDQADRENLRSVQNRRVECLFFDEDDLPDLSAHLSGGEIRSGPGGRESSGIYASGAYRYLYLDPMWWTGGELPIPGIDRTPREETIEEDLEHLSAPPHSEPHLVDAFDPNPRQAVQEGLALDIDDDD